MSIEHLHVRLESEVFINHLIGEKFGIARYQVVAHGAHSIKSNATACSISSVTLL
jgi:hypothetical protein